jgi:hypothetical protein
MLKPDAWDEAVAALDGIVGQIEAFPGLRSWVNAADRETGEGIAVAVFESSEALEAVTPQVNEILAGFGQYMSSPPSIAIRDVLAHIDNH